MGRNAVGFYWTLPVPWAGFKDLPADIEAAAEVSKTIRYQMELIRAYARDNGLALIREEAFLEVEPDRGTEYVLTALRKLEDDCSANAAALLYVDFSQVQGWRSHPPMEAWSRRKKIELMPIWPDPVRIDGKIFRPERHFREWRERQDVWSEGKEARMAKALKRAQALRKEGHSYRVIAHRLNEEALRSATGKQWSIDLVRKLISATVN